MSAQGGLPMWLQWAWGLAGVLAFFGAIGYVLFIFWPYLRWTRMMMLRSFELALQTAKLLSAIEEKSGPIVDALEVLINRIKGILDKIEPELGLDRPWVDPITGKGRPSTRSTTPPGRIGKILGALERIVKWLDPEDGTNGEPSQGAKELDERLEENKKRRRKKHVPRPIHSDVK